MDLTRFHPAPSNAKVNRLCWDTATLNLCLQWWKVILGLLSPSSFIRDHCCLLQNRRLSFEPLSKGFTHNFSWYLLFQSPWTSGTQPIFSSLGKLFRLTEHTPNERLQCRILAAFSHSSGHPRPLTPLLHGGVPWFDEKLCHCCGA